MSSTGGAVFSLQEIPDAEDFLILKQFVDESRAVQYTLGQRVRALFQEGESEWNWFNGVIKSTGPDEPSLTDSDFHKLGIM